MERKKTGLQAFKKCFALLLACAQVLTACGGTGKDPEGQPGETGQAAYAVTQETAVPDPDEALAGLEKGEDEIHEIHQVDYLFGGKRLYRLVRLNVREKDTYAIRESRDYLQVLDPPYEEWKAYRIAASYWDEEAEYEIYSLEGVIAAEEDRIYLKVRSGGEEACRVGVWSDAGSGGLLGTLPDDLQDLQLVVGDGKAVGAYRKFRDSLLLLGGGLDDVRVRGRVAARGSVWGSLWDSKGGELLWYGLSEEGGSGVWRAEDNEEVVRLPEGKGNITLAECSDEGVLYLANDQELWRCGEGGELESLFRFSDLDYSVEDLRGVSVQAGDALLLLAGFEGKDYVLQVEKAEGSVREKQELLLATDTEIGKCHFQQAVAQFNRRNREYRVKILEPEDGENGMDFWDRIQREMLAGGGPDLFLGFWMPAEDFARNGYLQEVSDFLPEEGALWQAALECGVIQGRQYGIPYECGLRVATYSRELTGGRESWTLEEMMEAVRDSGAEVLQAGAGGMDIVFYYGLYDNDNRKFIDWEKGESHLDEASFLDFLAFAKEYADQGYQRNRDPWVDPDVRLLEGKVAAKYLMSGVPLEYLNDLYASFRGKPAYIGFPREEGNGIYVTARSFYVSSLTKQREGCRAFLDFLLSEEVQKDYVEYDADRDPFSPRRGAMLAVRLSALERSVQLKKQEVKPEDAVEALTDEGIPYYNYGLSEEQEEAFWFLIEHARPGTFNIQELESMVFEELVPYFEGKRTAEEAAKALDSRVQLYLDERK